MLLILLSHIVNAVRQGECSTRPLLTTEALQRAIFKSLASVFFPVMVNRFQFNCVVD